MLRRPSTWCGPGYPCEVPGIWIGVFRKTSRTGGTTGFCAVRNSVGNRKRSAVARLRSRPRMAGSSYITGVDSAHIYRAGMMMLDLKDPSKVIARHPDCILEARG